MVLDSGRNEKKVPDLKLVGLAWGQRRTPKNLGQTGNFLAETGRVGESTPEGCHERITLGRGP